MVSPFRVQLSRKAESYFKRVDQPTAIKLKDVFLELEIHKQPKNSKPLKGELKGYHCIRLGNLRIIYLPDDVNNIIKVIDIGPRGDIYN